MGRNDEKIAAQAVGGEARFQAGRKTNKKIAADNGTQSDKQKAWGTNTINSDSAKVRQDLENLAMDYEKGKLLDLIKDQAAKPSSFTTMGNASLPSYERHDKDNKLISVLQTSDKEIAKRIKLATGWERGADKKWRYETNDFNGTSEIPSKPHSYEATKIELLAGTLVNSQKSGLDPNTNNSISSANLLKGVEKSYDKGKKILDES